MRCSTPELLRRSPLPFNALAMHPRTWRPRWADRERPRDNASKVIGERCGKGKGTVAWAADRPFASFGSLAQPTSGQVRHTISEGPVPPRGRSFPPARAVDPAFALAGCLAPPFHPAAHLGFARGARTLAGRHGGARLIGPAVLARFGVSGRCCEERGQEDATRVGGAPACEAQPHGQNRRASDDRQPCRAPKGRPCNRKGQSGKVPKTSQELPRSVHTPTPAKFAAVAMTARLEAAIRGATAPAEQPVVAAPLAHLADPSRLRSPTRGRGDAAFVAIRSPHAVSFSFGSERRGECERQHACEDGSRKPTCHGVLPSLDGKQSPLSPAARARELFDTG
jgi:hypothetical protein